MNYKVINLNEQVCTQLDTLNELENRINLLDQAQGNHTKVLGKIEDKIDRITWFLLGQTASACVALIIILVR